MSDDQEPIIIEATDDHGFQEYVYDDGSKVKDGEPVGVELTNPRTGEVELLLFSDIRYSNEPRR